VRRRLGIVERQRLLVEGQRRSAQHADPRAHRDQLPVQILPAQRPQLLITRRRGRRLDTRQHLDQRARLEVERRQWQSRRLGGRPPLGGAVVGVHIAGIVLPHRQDQPDVALRDAAQRIIRVGHGGHLP
jgi:hypothetical protein